MRALIALTLTACWMLVAPASALAAQPEEGRIGLEPYQFVRSLQRLQDQVAGGDQHALGMQKELFRTIRSEFRHPTQEVDLNELNLRAVLNFAVAGGGPAVLMPFRDALMEDEGLAEVALGAMAYRGNNASSVFAAVDTKEVGGMLGASIALVRGHGQQDAEMARKDLDFARMSAPGTIVEEAALRRLLRIHREQGDEAAFVRMASRYARAFGGSPYAKQFADEFVAGAVEMDDPAMRKQTLAVLSFLREPARMDVARGVARAATVALKRDLYYAVEEFAGFDEPLPVLGQSEPQSETTRNLLRLYNSIPTMDSANAKTVLMELEDINPAKLSNADRRLHTATLEVVRAILKPVPPASEADLATRANKIDARMMPKDTASMPKTEKQNTAAEETEIDDFISSMRGTLEGADVLLEKIE